VTKRLDEIYRLIDDDEPKKAGTKYERLAARVAKLLNQSALVVHDVKLIGDGKQTAHQLDVVVDSADGKRLRLLFECRDYDTAKVDLGEARSFATVVRHIRPEAAWIVTTVGFTRGARQLAADENIGLAVLKPAAESDHANLIKSVVLEMSFHIPSDSVRVVDLRWLPEAVERLKAAGLTGQEMSLTFAREDLLYDNHGTAVDTCGSFFDEVLQRANVRLGDHRYRVQVNPPRGFLVSGVLASFDEIEFDFEVSESRMEMTIEVVGDAVAELVLRSVDGSFPNRVIFADELAGLIINDHGHVIPKPDHRPKSRTKATLRHLDPDLE
jgi:Restriction endonuclease